jgi:hypothetical protein
MKPAITYIVSAFNRPLHLRGCLASLQVQTDPWLEVVVADNAPDLDMQGEHNAVVCEMRDKRFSRVNTAAHSSGPQFDCYWSAEWIVDNGLVHGEYIVLPSDDSYYVPVFQETMLAAARANDWALCYCDMLYDRRGHGRYHHKVVAPRVCEIDKTCFMLRRDCWIGFPTKPQTLKASSCDGEMIEELVRRGVRHGRVDEVLCVHN